MRSARRFIDRSRSRAALRRVASVLAMAALLFAVVAGAGKRYFFCAAMDRLFADHACCDGFEASLEDRMRSETQGVAIGEDERCCEERLSGALPEATQAPPCPAFEARWVAVLPEPVEHPLAFIAPELTRRVVTETTGPPPLRAPAQCARLSVFII